MSQIVCRYCGQLQWSIKLHEEQCRTRTLEIVPRAKVVLRTESSVTVVSRGSVTKQARWKASQGDQWRKHRADYMRRYRAGKDGV